VAHFAGWLAGQILGIPLIFRVFHFPDRLALFLR